MRRCVSIGYVCLFALALTAVARPAAAKTVDSGSFLLTGLLGPSFRLGSTLGGSTAYFLVAGQGEYTFDPIFSVVADLSVGAAASVPLRFHVGARGRLTDIGGPLSPYAQVQLAVGGIYNVLGANLTFLGARFAAGTDYFFTKSTAAGAMVGVDVGGTTGARPAFYGTVDVLLYGTYVF